MKTLILVRHAKSSWEYDVIDRERPLKKRGLNDAEIISSEFKKTKFIPDAVYSSPANRAYSTCQIFMEKLKIPIEEVTIVEDLYDFGGHSVTGFIKSLNNEIDSVMIFGHNHAFTSISNIFGSEYIDNVPTSGLVKIKFDVKKWDNIKKGKTELVLFPKDYR